MAIDKLVDSTQLDADLTSVANAIRAKNGTSESLAFPQDFIYAIDAIETGGGKKFNDVNFYDYDGTIFDSYTAAEFAELTAMPQNPDHSTDDVPLTSRGWNWSLSDAKAYVAKYGKLNVGQMYDTTDGKTHIFIHLDEGRTSPLLGCCPKGTVDVDWGDGTAHDTLTGTSLSVVKWTSKHNYAQPGDYEIILTCTGTMAFYGYSGDKQFSGLLRNSTGADDRNLTYLGAIERVHCAPNTVLNSYAFAYCRNLKFITLPVGIASIPDSAFGSCSCLCGVTIPSGVTQIGGNAFNSDMSLSSLVLPNGVTSLGTSWAGSCGRLLSLTIPEGVRAIMGEQSYRFNKSMLYITLPDGMTTIGGMAFADCVCLQFIRMPNSVTSIGERITYACSSMTSITISNRLTTIPKTAFGTCHNIRSIVIPESVTTIREYAFSGFYAISFYRMLSATPPTLSNTNVFQNIPSDCIIYVPRGSLEAYKTATNWSTYANKMQEEP